MKRNYKLFLKAYVKFYINSHFFDKHHKQIFPVATEKDPIKQLSHDT